ncbi:calcium/sodium antiporter, partial [Streptomyces durbertensis]|nr:calcium/sodium antiporter [Streptomyces durbertensis]
GEVLVRGASGLARRAGISSLVVGLTVVSLATSAPELAVTVGAVARDEPGLAVGNVVGSNIANVLLILGVSALVLPLLVTRRLIRIDVPIMLVLSGLLLVLSLDGRIGAVDGGLFLAVLVGYLTLSVVLGRAKRPVAVLEGEEAEEKAASGADEEFRPLPVWLAVLLVVAGVALLVGGAHLLVEGAVNVATELGVSSLVVGLTVVAVGTSLPELAVSVVAVRRGERDMAVGNIVGSNIANIGLVLGLPALLAAGGLPVPAEAVALDLPLMVAASVALLPIAFTGFVISRWEGGLFVALYLAYMAYLVLAATEHDALSGFTAVMVWFVLPLVAVTVLVFTLYEVRLRRLRAAARR